MDIKDILSPSEKDAPKVSSTPSSPHPSPFKYVQRTQSGPVPVGINKTGPGASALSHTVLSQPNIPAHILSPAHGAIVSPLISPVPNSSNNSYLQRTLSTQSMDTLADLASMQNHQPVGSRRGGGSFDGHKSPSFPPSITTNLTSNPRASIDINMMEAPKQTARTDFSGTSLSSQNQERLTQLAEYLQENPSAYSSHIEMIKILHDGLVDHIYPSSDPRSRRDPRSYGLLEDLRRAREQMAKLFAVGEELWCDWLQDDSLLAQSVEERWAVVEKCQKAVEEEAGSIKLWLTYCDWVHHCYVWAHGNNGRFDNVTDEDRLASKELFTWQLVLDAWQEASDQTSNNIAQSHLIWDKYLEFRLPNLQDKLNSTQVSTAMALFQERLQVPHLQWDNTFQAFSGFVSHNLESQYESIMMETNRSASKVKGFVTDRESFEESIEQAQTSGDRDAEYLAFSQYIEWERTPEKRRKPDAELIDALYRRAELRFPSDTSIWEEHATFLIERSLPSLMPLLERATKHCPWSGSLWTHYLLASERKGDKFHETEAIKHQATSTGLLDAAGIEEIIAVHTAWCSYLRRRATSRDSNEEDIDVAEMGIRSSIENVSSLGVKLGLGEVPGSSFRLRRIYITFLTDSGRWDNARHEFDQSVRDYGKSYEFWMQFYHWEMMRWRRFASNRQNTREPVGSIEPPALATAVLKKALDQSNLDYPEPIMQAFLIHCEDHTDAEELQQALLTVRKLEKAVATRRQVESAQASKAADVKPPQHEEVDSTNQISKRKREDEADDEKIFKRLRSEEEASESVEPNVVTDPKRDRENASILVQNLPEHITNVRLRQYFSNCGNVRSLKVTHEDDISAIIEFDDDEAAKYALSRDGRELDGAIISVVLDTGSTLYLSNYKPSSDEAYIRSLLQTYGEIISVRFPSLQGNKNRRFCYVQFKLAAQAQAATELDGKEIDGLPITCKISNPAIRKQRADKSQVNDGSTIFVGQLNFKTTEEELTDAFRSFGKIKLVRMPRNETMKNRNKGIAFITFDNEEVARSALSMDQKELKERKIVVKIATNESRHDSTSKRTASPMPNGQLGSPAPSSLSHHDELRERQIFLTNIPDTVNEARLQEIASKYGTVLRTVLKTNHQGAILEFSTPAEAGEAALKLDGHEIDAGRPISVVTEAEMKGMSKEKKIDSLGTTKSRNPAPKAAPIGLSAPIKRPGQPVRKGGHLGQRSSTVFKGHTTKADGETNGNKQKSNDDFRNMLKKS